MKALILFSTFLFVIQCYGQQQNNDGEVKTLLGSIEDYGGYMAPEVKVAQVFKEPGMLLGCQGGLLLNHKFLIGMSAYGQTVKTQFTGMGNSLQDTSLTLKMNYAGAFMQYALLYKLPVHVSIPVLIGMGNAEIKEDRSLYYGDNWDDPSAYSSRFVESTSFIVVEPGVNIDINLTKYVQLSLGGSYRNVLGSSMVRLSDAQLSGWSCNMSLRFGNF